MIVVVVHNVWDIYCCKNEDKVSRKIITVVECGHDILVLVELGVFKVDT